MPPSATLLVAMSRGDESAARELHAQIGPRLMAYTRALLRDDHAAEDVVQQAWLRAVSRPREELARVSDVMAWMVRLTRTTALNDLRSRSRAKARDRLRAYQIKPATAPTPVDDLHAAIDALADDHREVVLLKHVANLTFDQMAETLGENRSTIASRYRAALDTLRTHLHVAEEANCA